MNIFNPNYNYPIEKPPTFYSIINSALNYGKNEDEKIKIFNFPIVAGRFVFDDFIYPLKDTSFDLNIFRPMFISHFLMRRIGQDTYLAFKLQLQSKLLEVMPKYKMLVDSFEKGYGNIETTNRQTEDKRNSNSESVSESKSAIKNTNDNRYSDTPQSKIADVKSGEYMTEYTFNESNSDNNNNIKSNVSGTDNSNLTEDIIKKQINNIELYKIFLDNNSSLLNKMLKEFDSLFYQLV